MLDLEKLEGRIREKEKEIKHLSHELQKTGKDSAFEKMHRLSNQLAHAEAIMGIITRVGTIGCIMIR